MKEKAILVGCELPTNEERFAESMKELQALTETANGKVVHIVTQKRQRIDPAYYIGKGKLKEIATLLESDEIDLIIFNDELSVSQLRNLSDYFQIKIVDRTQLILDIFAARARSKEGKLQVELAQLKYMLPRLAGQGAALSRLGGGIGTRGPGETQLEIDRRHIRRRIQALETQLKKIVQHRTLYKQRRKKNDVFQVTLVGYTNAGKSTLFNRISGEDSFAEDKLFATLDPLTRKLDLSLPIPVLLTDTVGFIQDLPTELVAAFRSTLEEVADADLILHVIDASHEHFSEHEKTVNRLLKDLNADRIPKIHVYNKKDLVTSRILPFSSEESLFISAFDDGDIQRLLSVIKEKIINQFIPYRLFISALDGKKLALLESKTIMKEKVWIDEKQQFFVSGFAPKHVADTIFQ